MLTPGRSDLFEFEFPVEFVPQKIIDKYKTYLNRRPNVLTDNIREYINQSIQKINIPGFSYDPQTQNQGTNTVAFRDSISAQEHAEKQLTVTFLASDGWVNWSALFECYLYHYSFRNSELHTKPFRVFLTDSDGLRLVTLVFSQILFVSFDGFPLDYSDNSQEFKTFDCTFTFNLLHVDLLGFGGDDNNNLSFR